MGTSTSFKPVEFFQKPTDGFSFLPFRFKRLDKATVLVTNIAGEFLYLTNDEFSLLISKDVKRGTDLYCRLLLKHFISDNQAIDLDLLASKLWTKKSIIQGFTKLHIFVLTLRCNCACSYCQVTRQDEDASRNYDMSIETARRATEVMMESPNPDITVEFQGGEPLLNMEALKEIVLYSEQLNITRKKRLNYVVCTNLSLLDNEMLAFFKEHNVCISTSIDGPAYLHDLNRCRHKKDACHDVVTEKIKQARSVLGRSQVSALMTTTRYSLSYAKEIIDEYIRLDLGSIFIRALNPYGYAVKTNKVIGYSVEEFFKFYKTSFEYILELNKNGILFPEAYTTLLLRKILTPWPIGFVDLQSPTGNGFSVTVYNYDGDVYASDESRMLYEMGDSTFRLGSVLTDTYQEIYFGQAMQYIATNGIAECIAGCSECAFVPYCGADPIRNHTVQADAYGHRPSSLLCKKHHEIFKYLFDFLRNMDSKEEEVIWAWLNDCGLDEVSMGSEG